MSFIPRVLVWSLAVVATTPLAAAPDREESLPATPQPAWDAVFARTEGWTGGDAVYSVGLCDGRVLWLFGDTWVGRVEDGGHVPGSRLVNNSIGVQRIPEKGAAPQPDEIAFYWGPDDREGHPTAWIRPPNAEEWYWPADGLVGGAGGERRLSVFLWTLRRAGVEGVWNFETAGGAVAVATNLDADVRDWRVRQFVNPHAAVPEKDGAREPERAIGWGGAVAEWTDAGRTYALIYGARRKDWGNELLLARAPAERIEAFDRWEFFVDGNWSPRMADATPVVSGVMNELSVSRFESADGPRWALTSSEVLFGDRIFVRTSRSPLGPWSRPKAVFRVPDVQRNRAYFTYAAKAHPEVSAPGELLISYVVNSQDFGAMFRDAAIYRPRFVSVPAAAILGTR